MSLDIFFWCMIDHHLHLHYHFLGHLSFLFVYYNLCHCTRVQFFSLPYQLDMKICMELQIACVFDNIKYGHCVAVACIVIMIKCGEAT